MRTHGRGYEDDCPRHRGIRIRSETTERPILRSRDRDEYRSLSSALRREQRDTRIIACNYARCVSMSKFTRYATTSYTVYKLRSYVNGHNGKEKDRRWYRRERSDTVTQKRPEPRNLDTCYAPRYQSLPYPFLRCVRGTEKMQFPPSPPAGPEITRLAHRYHPRGS